MSACHKVNLKEENNITTTTNIYIVQEREGKGRVGSR